MWAISNEKENMRKKKYEENPEPRRKYEKENMKKILNQKGNMKKKI